MVVSKKEHKKTNAMRMLDTHKIGYEVLAYEWEEGRGAGVHVAEELHLPEAQVFKTLVGKGNVTGPVVFCIPVAAELDLKQAARVSGNKSVELIAVKDLLGLTGYLRGGCSPVGMKKLFPTYLEQTAQSQETIIVSAGKRGHQMELAPQAICDLTKGTFADLVL